MFDLQNAIQIVIPEGEVQQITDSAGSVLWQKADNISFPYNANKSDANPVSIINISAGDTVTISYYPTAAGGVVYDASNCGGSDYTIQSYELNAIQTKTFIASKTGKLVIGGTYQYYSWGMDWPGSIGMNAPYCKYIIVRIK